MKQAVQYVPTTTGRRKPVEHPVHLCSPSAKWARPEDNSNLVIIDCHTYYLRSFASDKAVDHYKWLCEYVAAYKNKQDQLTVFVAPDWDWADPYSKLDHLWPHPEYQLVVPGSRLFGKVKDPVGWAIAGRCRPDSIPESVNWVHHFSQQFTPYENINAWQTYDSVSPI